MNEWTPPILIGFRESACDPASSGMPVANIFDALGIAVQDCLPSQSWALVQRRSAEPADAEQIDTLELVRPDGVKLSIDFSSGKARHRAKEAGKGIQPLARALGAPGYRKKFGTLPSIIDATGGLGQDSWALASLGMPITMIERHPIVHALLANALARAIEHPDTCEIASRITLLAGTAEQLLPTATGQVIYLDPMYPERSRKKAGSRKGMQFLHALLGPAEAEAGARLLHAALQCPVDRVVVKRPRGAELLGDTGTWQGQRTEMESPNTRYDVYHCR
ncbi:class I SAM-dependent methyltransferase [Granulosicoccus antarcticus]|uniref:Ribosomal RNA small subunit methyltransferase J n=1 Tax=Granulosicoccus antarcticus IMCC3135 TaxID=1192854 RepID=A0A2Z2NYI9_9GAMM|nr:class I SAM-dependent methyltransferase [Granulosicoccus antarcticus]ASJ72214.1 Ribosomal RNA small subunit methyltransferase J [Granulosicoccus antarcticus IMCC3135]